MTHQPQQPELHLTLVDTCPTCMVDCCKISCINSLFVFPCAAHHLINNSCSISVVPSCCFSVQLLEAEKNVLHDDLLVIAVKGGATDIRYYSVLL